MHRLPGLGFALAVALTVSLAHATPTGLPAPPPCRGLHPVQTLRAFHPIQAVRGRWRQGRALRQLEKVILSKPRVVVKLEERFGKLGGKKQFASRGALAMLGIGTAVNIGGFLQSDLLIPYLIAGAVVDLSAFATHIIGNRRQRNKALISLIEDGTISDTDLHPFRKALGMTDEGRKLGRFPVMSKH